MRIPGLIACALVANSAVLAAQQASADTTVLAASAVEEQPALVPNSCRAPQYPAVLRQARLEGRVVLRFVVDATGRVDPASVSVVTSTYSQFESSARQAIASCRYRPARFNDRPVRVLVQAPVEYRLPRS